jgi:acyl-CoA reductase-like NAD-dependent aldehyde dehydrogenase
MYERFGLFIAGEWRPAAKQVTPPVISPVTAFTRSPSRARRTVADLKARMVGVNSFAVAASEAPFGGTNFSGMGREGGVEGIRDYLDVKLAQAVF